MYQITVKKEEIPCCRLTIGANDNKKSRIYGTADLICLSISFAKIGIGLKCTENRPQMYSCLIGSDGESLLYI